MEYLFALQNLRELSPQAVTLFFLFISEVVLRGALVLVAIVYWCINKQEGIHITFGYTTAYLINQTVKNICCVPRPWLRDSRLYVYPAAEGSATGFSFPSGHTVTAGACFGGTLAWKRKNKKIVISMIILTLLVAFSRNFLGCHTMADVLSALFISAVSVIFIRAFTLWFSRHQDKELLVCVLGCLLSVIILIIMQLKPYDVENAYPLITDCYTSCGMFCGALTGWVLERRFVRFSADVPRKQKFWRGFWGVITLAVLYFGGSPALSFMGAHFAHLVKYFVIFIYLVFLYPLIFTRIEKRKGAD